MKDFLTVIGFANDRQVRICFHDENDSLDESDFNILDPAKSQRYYNHSPDGFAWGYSGSGPSQLALALYAECFDAIKSYMSFRDEVLSKLDIHKDFIIHLKIDRENKKLIQTNI